MKTLFIVGPTATGKTTLGIKLAKKFNGEIISADSRQIYQHMDVGTGKDLPKNSKFNLIDSLRVGNDQLSIGYHKLDNIPVWLYDIVPPDYSFSLAHYLLAFENAIAHITQKGKLPIIVGGTGLYIKSILHPPDTLGIPPNVALRNELITYSLIQLQDLLQKLNKSSYEKMNHSDQNNPRRLIRSIEIQKYKSKNKPIIKPLSLEPLIIGLKASTTSLSQNIPHRIEKRLDEGMIKEVKKLKIVLGKHHLPSSSALGYQQIMDYLDKKNNQSEAIKKWTLLEQQYIKRQLTWFNKQKSINWFTLDKKDFQSDIVGLVTRWYIESDVPSTL